MENMVQKEACARKKSSSLCLQVLLNHGNKRTHTEAPDSPHVRSEALWQQRNDESSES